MAPKSSSTPTVRLSTPTVRLSGGRKALGDYKSLQCAVAAAAVVSLTSSKEAVVDLFDEWVARVKVKLVQAHTQGVSDWYKVQVRGFVPSGTYEDLETAVAQAAVDAFLSAQDYRMDIMVADVTANRTKLTVTVRVR
ncbi:MAG: hypothetical protein ABH877_04390 [bacterium]